MSPLGLRAARPPPRRVQPRTALPRPEPQPGGGAGRRGAGLASRGGASANQCAGPGHQRMLPSDAALTPPASSSLSPDPADPSQTARPASWNQALLAGPAPTHSPPTLTAGHPRSVLLVAPARGFPDLEIMATHSLQERPDSLDLLAIFPASARGEGQRWVPLGRGRALHHGSLPHLPCSPRSPSAGGPSPPTCSSGSPQPVGRHDPPKWEPAPASPLGGPTRLVSGCSCLPAPEVPPPTTRQIQPALWGHPAVCQPHGSWWLHRLVCPSATNCLGPSTSRGVPTTSPTANRISLLDTKHHCRHPGENVPAGTALWDELGLIHGAAGTPLQGQPQAAPPAPPWSSVQGCGAQAPQSPTGLHPSLPSVLTQGSSLGAHTLPRWAATFRRPPFLPQARRVLGLDWGARDDTTGVKPAAPTGTGW